MPQSLAKIVNCALKVAPLLALGWGLAAPRVAAADSPPGASAERDGQPRQGDDLSGLHAFDLRAGCWTFHNHVLKERLANNHDWFDYDAIQRLWITMGGYGNMDDNELRKPDGTYYGVTVRTYDRKSGTWSIWWYDGRNPSADLDPPVKGRFKDGVGTFYSDDKLRGKPIKVRFTWSGITAAAAHWEQAFSGDGGKTWETNWTADFSKIDCTAH